MNCRWIVYFNFSVVESGKSYPASFIANLPKEKVNHCKSFCEAFKGIDDRTALALSLLKEALENPEYSSDIDIKNAILERIKILSPKPTETATCKGCGISFERVISKGKKQPYCQPCRDLYYQKFQKPCANCGKIFNAYKSDTCPKCFKEQQELTPAYYTSKNEGYRPKPKLCFLPRNVIEAFREEGF